MKILGVVGSRGYHDYREFSNILDEYIFDVLVSGGCTSGADMMAEWYAKDNCFPIIIFRPDWKKYGRRAAYLRNKQIVERSGAILAFWDGKSPGTKMTIDLAKEKGLTVYIHMITKK